MDEITRTNTTRILKFLQPFELDFNNFSVWSYARRKFKDEGTTQQLLEDAVTYLKTTGYIERVRRPGYYRLTEKGKNFMGWELENIQETNENPPEPQPSTWSNWFFSSKKEKV